MSVLGRKVRISLWHVFLLLATSAFAATVVVTNTNTSGPGSLSDAVNAVNNGTASEIDFNVAPGGVQTIAVPSELDLYNSVIVNGKTQPGYGGTPLIELIGGAANRGFLFPVSGNVTVEGLAFGNFSTALTFVGSPGPSFNVIGNYLGIAPDGTTTVQNQNGIEIQGGFGQIGDGTAAGANVISGNNVGIFANFSPAPLLVAGNFLGVAGDHVTAKPNKAGIEAFSPMIIGGPGRGNTIAFNSVFGIEATRPGISASQNSIYSNPPAMGIFYPLTPPQAAPALLSAQATASSTTIAGNVTTTLPTQNLTLEFFSNPVAEQQGKTFLGSTNVTTDITGAATFSATVPVPVAAGFVNATATLYAGPPPFSTSPFSNDTPVTECPMITAQPSSATICAPQTNTFSVAASGTSITYQWRSSPDGSTWTNISGANSPTYTTGVADFYDVVVSNACPSPATSNTVSLTVNMPPAIGAQPSNVAVCATQPATFTVGATGTGLTYQWQKGGVPIPGATAATYTIPSTSTSDAGTYNVVASGTCAPPATSNNVTLTVNAPPSITTQPSNATACPGQPASFTVVASGTGLAYQWQKGGVNIPGANAATYTIPSVSASNAGSYDVVISGTCTPSATSSSANLTVTAPTTTIALTMTPTFGHTGQPATFNITVTGNCAVPAGTVTVSDGPLGTATLNNGSATLTVIMPGPTNSVTVQYSGDSIYPPNSATFAVNVGETIPTLDPRVLVLLALALAAAGFIALRRV